MNWMRVVVMGQHFLHPSPVLLLMIELNYISVSFIIRVYLKELALLFTNPGTREVKITTEAAAVPGEGPVIQIGAIRELTCMRFCICGGLQWMEPEQQLQ